MKGLGKKQKEIIEHLKSNPDRFIEVVADDSDMTEQRYIGDGDLNSYLDIPKRVMESLVKREIICMFDQFRPSINVHIFKYRLSNKYLSSLLPKKYQDAGWVTENDGGISITYNKKYFNNFFWSEKTDKPTQSHSYIIIDHNEKT